MAPAGDLVAVRDAGGRLQVVGKRFNAFAAEQWLSADGDDRDPAAAREADARCDPAGCIAALPQGRLLSLVTAVSAFEEDCTRAAIVVSALPGLPDCNAQLFDQPRLARTGAVGLTFDGARLLVATDRSTLEDRPWSPASKRSPNDRIVQPRPGGTPGGDPADPDPSASWESLESGSR